MESLSQGDNCFKETHIRFFQRIESFRYCGRSSTYLSKQGRVRGCLRTSITFHICATSAPRGAAGMIIKSDTCNVALIDGSSPGGVSMMTTSSSASEDVMRSSCRGMAMETSKSNGVPDSSAGSVAKIVKLEHAWRRLDGRNDDGFQVAPFPG